MISALRWQTLIPRVLTVVVALLTVQYLLGLAARSVAIHSGESMTGGGFELSHAKVSLLDGKLVLSDVRVPAHGGADENILEADRCELEFAAAPLLRKQAIVNRGRISGLRFGSTTATNTVEAKKNAKTANAAPSIAWQSEDGHAVARAWLAQLGERFDRNVVEQLDSVKRTEALCSRWSAQSAELETRRRELEERAAELQRSVDAAQANPLRNDKILDTLPQKVAALRSDFDEINATYAKLPDWLDAERRAIVASRRNDGAQLLERLQVEPIEAGALSAYLLREQVAAPVNELICGLQSVREVLQADSAAVRPTKRGEDILFAGCRPAPGVLIRALELQGAGRFSGQPFELRGMLTGFNTAPAQHGEPIRLRLKTQGSMRLELQATIDRRGAVARDELVADCRGIFLPSATLGRSDEFKIEVAPTIGSVSVSMDVEGDKLAGEIQIVQTNAELTPAMNGKLANVPFGSALGDALGHVDSVASRVTLGGTLDEPTGSLSSNLGPAVAEAMDSSIRRVADSHSRALATQAGKRVDERLADLERQITERRAKFASQTMSLASQLEGIVGEQAPRYRISAGQNGRRLPANSLFR